MAAEDNARIKYMNAHQDGKIMVIDYGLGNHQSVVNALELLGYNIVVSDQVDDMRTAKAFVLPGVGAFSEAFKNIEKLRLRDPLNEEVLGKKKHILGICLGMQLLASDSEEGGKHEGFGWIEGHVVKMGASEGFRVPHVGWNDLDVRKKSPLFEMTEEGANFYFDHSYQFECEDENIAATTGHGTNVVAAVQKDNVYGVQFHPEKSQNNGLKIFRCFFNHVFGKARG